MPGDLPVAGELGDSGIGPGFDFRSLGPGGAPEELPFGERHLVLGRDDHWALKDPVIIRGQEGWRMWAYCHPLADRGRGPDDHPHATSVDGLRWRDRGVVLGAMPGTWDARSARITAILNEAPLPRTGLSGLAWLGNRMGR
jgi:hypothetical protein